MGGKSGYCDGHVDRLRVRVLADARLLPRSLRCGSGRKLLQGVRSSASRTPVSLRLAACAGRRCVAVLLFLAGGCDRSSGGDSHHAAISGAGHRSDRIAHSTAGFAASVSNVAISVAGVNRFRWIRVYTYLSHQFPDSNSLRSGDPDYWHDHLHDPCLAQSRVAVWGGRTCIGGRGSEQLNMADSVNTPLAESSHPQTQGSAWTPLGEPLFRSLWLAAVSFVIWTLVEN